MKEIGADAVKVLEFRQLKSYINSYTHYELGLTKIIGYPGYRHGDTVVKNIMSYSEWLATNTEYPVIKIEGIELDFKIPCKNLHLFVHQQHGLSFNWHRDEVDVLLYVIKGSKTVYMQHRKILVHAGQHIKIPKGIRHRVISRKNTWAVSIGY